MSCPEAQTTDAGARLAGAKLRLGKAWRFPPPGHRRESAPIGLAPTGATLVAAGPARRVRRQRGGHERRACTCRLACVLWD
jgi:hypothetical protein